MCRVVTPKEWKVPEVKHLLPKVKPKGAITCGTPPL